MPEYFIGALITIMIGAAGNLFGRLGRLDHRIDALEVKIAENYVTKADLMRFEDKLDAVVMAQHNTFTSRISPGQRPVTSDKPIEKQQ